MKSLWKHLFRCTIVVGMSAGVTGTLVAQDSEQVGIVRVSNPKTTDVANGQVLPVSASQIDGGCNTTVGTPASTACNTSTSGKASGPMASGTMGSGTMEMGNGDGHRGYRKYYRQDWRYSDWQAGDCWGSGLHRRTQNQSRAFERSFNQTTGHRSSLYYHDPTGQDMIDYFKCKFGYFIPSGGGGAGIPWVGHYSRVYPVNPAYSDARDGQIWAAQGYGIPIAVPLAPIVGHTYDYGWGVPSSRLTPISHPAY